MARYYYKHRNKNHYLSLKAALENDSNYVAITKEEFFSANISTGQKSSILQSLKERH